ncbi:MAG: response regulator [Desulfomonile tiedjei]|uniref:Response regulator n=1 Tax=Desulfomonile tiedjei TaxID=2358 RepID=A0A9D6V0G8_9BACT|nr:response regulator [Desulfomonile tiedjei]
MNGRVLLVDDNEDFLDSTKDVLEEEGYQISTASSGIEAIRQFNNNRFDVVVMDIKMPGLNGVETLALMKKHDPHVNVIMCTAYIVENLIREALEEGAYAVLNKPFEMDLLIRTIENARDRCHCGYILVADRDPKLCAQLEKVLTGKGHKAIVANDGREALLKARKHAFNLLLLDAKLPVVNCFEVYERIRRMRPDLFATIVTGFHDELDSDTQNKIRKANGITSLTKPLDLDQLLELLDSICTAGNVENMKTGG